MPWMKIEKTVKKAIKQEKIPKENAGFLIWDFLIPSFKLGIEQLIR